MDHFLKKRATIVEKRPDKAPEAKLPIPPQHKPKKVKDSSQNPTCDHSDASRSHDLPKEERQTSARASWNDPMKSEHKETLEVLLRKVERERYFSY
ncbi:hypothetical protein R3I94_003258 [Phoxinus phoxinus]